MLEGEVVVQTPGEAALLGPGDYGWIPLGVPHSLRNVGESRVQLGPDVRADTAGRARHGHYVVAELPPTEPVRPDVRDPRTRRYGHIDPENMDPR